MSKINKISITHLKAIDVFEADFRGCTAIVTAGNNQGKTTFLRSIPDRVRGIIPAMIVKEGEENGKGEMILNTGERFIWEFDKAGKDKMTFISKDNFKIDISKPGAKSSRDIIDRFFPSVFDIDKFLFDTPAKQSAQLQKIIGIDFTDIDKRYKTAYDQRTNANTSLDNETKRLPDSKPAEVKKIELTEMREQKNILQTDRANSRKIIDDKLNELYKANKKSNDDARDKWGKEKVKIFNDCVKHNEAETVKLQVYNDCGDALRILAKHNYGGNEVANWMEGLKKAMLPNKVAEKLSKST